MRQSFFHDDSRNFADVGGGVVGCRGFHSSFRTIHGGLSLNMGMVSLHFFIELSDFFVLVLFKCGLHFVMYFFFALCRCINHYDSNSWTRD